MANSEKISRRDFLKHAAATVVAGLLPEQGVQPAPAEASSPIEQPALPWPEILPIPGKAENVSTVVGNDGLETVFFWLNNAEGVLNVIPNSLDPNIITSIWCDNGVYSAAYNPAQTSENPEMITMHRFGGNDRPGACYFSQGLDDPLFLMTTGSTEGEIKSPNLLYLKVEDEIVRTNVYVQGNMVFINYENVDSIQSADNGGLVCSRFLNYVKSQLKSINAIEEKDVHSHVLKTLISKINQGLTKQERGNFLASPLGNEELLSKVVSELTVLIDPYQSYLWFDLPDFRLIGATTVQAIADGNCIHELAEIEIEGRKYLFYAQTKMYRSGSDLEIDTEFLPPLVIQRNRSHDAFKPVLAVGPSLDPENEEASYVPWIAYINNDKLYVTSVQFKKINQESYAILDFWKILENVEPDNLEIALAYLPGKAPLVSWVESSQPTVINLEELNWEYDFPSSTLHSSIPVQTLKTEAVTKNEEAQILALITSFNGTSTQIYKMLLDPRSKRSFLARVIAGRANSNLAALEERGQESNRERQEILLENGVSHRL